MADVLSARCCRVVVVAAVAAIFSCISIIVIALRVQIVQFAVVVSSLWSVVCSRFWADPPAVGRP